MEAIDLPVSSSSSGGRNVKPTRVIPIVGFSGGRNARRRHGITYGLARQNDGGPVPSIRVGTSLPDWHASTRPPTEARATSHPRASTR
jgi:hypothetical protein